MDVFHAVDERRTFDYTGHVIFQREREVREMAARWLHGSKVVVDAVTVFSDLFELFAHCRRLNVKNCLIIIAQVLQTNYLYISSEIHLGSVTFLNENLSRRESLIKRYSEFEKGHENSYYRVLRTKQD